MTLNKLTYSVPDTVSEHNSLFFTFILLEKLYGWYIKKEKVNNMDTVSSLSSAITMVTKNVLGLSITIISYSWIEEKIANSIALDYPSDRIQFMMSPIM